MSDTKCKRIRVNAVTNGIRFCLRFPAVHLSVDSIAGGIRDNFEGFVEAFFFGLGYIDAGR